MGPLTVVAETERIVIRPWRPDEADRLFDLLRRMEVAKWLGATPEKASGIPAGTVLLKPPPDGDGEVEIGWHFHADSWGKGLASEAAGALLARAFDDGLKEVWAVTHLDNHASMAVCRRIGMHLLGVTRRW
jgi:RimJ/RimL family protein N-acetyltransferase